eukprot:scaffold70379_cov19-Tisochrysis_lutea.AAC.1
MQPLPAIKALSRKVWLQEIAQAMTVPAKGLAVRASQETAACKLGIMEVVPSSTIRSALCYGTQETSKVKGRPQPI